jgi:hypothetical protein
MKIQSLLLAFVLAIASSQQFFDRCNPEWVRLIQRDELYDCADPTSDNRVINDASTFVAVTNIIAKLGLKVEGQEPNPKIFARYIQKGQASGRWESINDVYRSIGLNVRGEQKELEQLRGYLAQGLDIVAILNQSDEAVLVKELKGDEEVSVINSRGKTVNVHYHELDLPLLLFTRAQARFLEFEADE